VDFHHYEELIDNPALHEARFLAIWAALGERYAELPSAVAFELLNEPNTTLDSRWNGLLAQTVEVVRESNPERLLIVDAPRWAAPTALSELVVPDDSNLMVAVHIYEPSLFTFQGQDWIGPIWGTTGIVFPGPPPQPVVPVAAAQAEPWANAWFEAYNTLPAEENPAGRSGMQTEFDAVDEFVARTGHAVYNGEWGAQDGGDLESRANWMRLVRQECETRGIGWAVWDDQGALKLFDTAARSWEEELIETLFD
jgi:endoglucanase